jgi:hypothetical protein
MSNQSHRTCLVYIREDTIQAFSKLKSVARSRGIPLNYLLCLAVQELATHRDPMFMLVQRLGLEKGDGQ